MGIHFRPEGHKIPEKVVQSGEESQTNDLENPFVRTTEKTNLCKEKISAPKREKSLPSRTIVPMVDLDDCTRRIEEIDKGWDELDPEMLAEEIIDLEDRISLFQGEPTDEVRKVQAQVKHLHFQYVFPLVKTLQLEGNDKVETIEISFARQVYNLAKEIIETNSVAPFAELSPMQQWEVRRHAISVGGGR